MLGKKGFTLLPLSSTAIMDGPSIPDGREQTSEQAEATATGDNDSGATPPSAAVDSAARLQRLLQGDAGLALWLEYTRYFDLNHRERVLSDLRKLKTMEEERDKLLQEIHRTTSGLVQSSAIKASSEVLSSKPKLPSAPEHVIPLTSTSASSSVRGGFLSDRPMPPPPLPMPPPPLPMPVPSVVKGTRDYPMWRGYPAHAVTDSRFFLVKCSNTANIYMSQRDVGFPRPLYLLPSG